MNSQRADVPVAVVSGGSGGIGAAICRQLVAKGYRVVATARKIERLQDLHRELGELMTTKVGVVRDNRALDAADRALQDLAARCRRLDLGEASTWANQTLAYGVMVIELFLV